MKCYEYNNKIVNTIFFTNFITGNFDKLLKKGENQYVYLVYFCPISCLSLDLKISRVYELGNEVGLFLRCKNIDKNSTLFLAFQVGLVA